MNETAGAAQLDKAPEAFRTISEVADELDVPQHVLRFWETRFPQIKPMKRGGGRRYYRPDDIDLLRGIRHLLYGEGYTIRGVQGIFRDKDKGPKFVQSAWKSGALQPELPGAEHVGEEIEPAASVVEPTFGTHDAESARSSIAVEPVPQPVRGPAARQIPRSNLQPAAAVTTPAQPDSQPKPVRPPAPSAPLPQEHVRALQKTLYELGECRRLLDAALKDD
jgi:DNA-binding transcriptional MerR regulator